MMKDTKRFVPEFNCVWNNGCHATLYSTCDVWLVSQLYNVYTYRLGEPTTPPTSVTDCQCDTLTWELMTKVQQSEMDQCMRGTGSMYLIYTLLVAVFNGQ